MRATTVFRTRCTRFALRSIRGAKGSYARLFARIRSANRLNR